MSPLPAGEIMVCVLLVAACARMPSGAIVADSSEPPRTDASPEPAVTAVDAREPDALAGDASKAPDGALARALAGRMGTLGIFWIPKNDGFLDEDLLLMPDGTYITHLHQHPGSAGEWSLDRDVLTLHGWLGDRTFVIRSLRIRGNELRGVGDDGPLVMKKHAP